MRRNRRWVNEVSDGLGGEIDFSNFMQNYPCSGAITKRNQDDVAGLQIEVRAISKRAAALSVDFSWYYLIKHEVIIAYRGGLGCCKKYLKTRAKWL